MTANKTRERSRGLSFALFLGLLVSGFMIGSSADAAESCGPHRVNSFTLDIAATSNLLSIGDTARFEVRVERAAADKTVGPAEHAHVVGVITVDDVSVAAVGETDHDGLVTLSVKLPRKMRPGFADVSAVATYEPAHCVEEYGEAEVKKLFKVVR